MTCVGFIILRVPDITRLETETYEASRNMMIKNMETFHTQPEIQLNPNHTGVSEYLIIRGEYIL